jgi:hypothetical protein
VGRQLGKSAPSFRPLTFQRGSIFSAQFAPYGQTVVYSAAWNGEPKELYSTRIGSPESRPLPYPGADVAGISPSGEMALIKDAVLSRIALAGGGSREILQDVLAADWSPDGSSLAVVHRVSGRTRLEYPIGKVLYETNGSIGGACVSPRGDRIAFFDRPLGHDDRGSLAVVTLDGKKKTLSTGWFATMSLAWSPVGDEIWFNALRRGGRRGEIYAISASGRERIALAVPGDFGVLDVSHDGRALMMLAACPVSLVGLFPGGSRERDLSWFDWSDVVDLSADGRTLLFREAGEGGNSTFHAVYTRKTDGSPAVRIGEGVALRLSPDGRWAIATFDIPPRLTLLPTGTGSARALERGPIEQYLWGGGWFPDGVTILAGARLGPHEVISCLGAGGMGEVWRARDSRLNRDVAIKILPAELSSDQSRLHRFEKEARSASALEPSQHRHDLRDRILRQPVGAGLKGIYQDEITIGVECLLAKGLRPRWNPHWRLYP